MLSRFKLPPVVKLASLFMREGEFQPEKAIKVGAAGRYGADPIEPAGGGDIKSAQIRGPGGKLIRPEPRLGYQWRSSGP